MTLHDTHQGGSCRRPRGLRSAGGKAAVGLFLICALALSLFSAGRAGPPPLLSRADAIEIALDVVVPATAPRPVTAYMTAGMLMPGDTVVFEIQTAFLTQNPIPATKLKKATQLSQQEHLYPLDAALGPVTRPGTPFPDEDVEPPVENRGLVHPEIEVFNAGVQALPMGLGLPDQRPGALS
jgi:hypothetical protein